MQHPENPSPTPLAGAYVSGVNNSVIDFMFNCHMAWVQAIMKDYYRFWLEPYLHERTGKRPPGYYYRLARLKPR
jgi:hypothetical protein